MAEQRQIMLEQPVPPDRPLGSSNPSNSKAIFAASPIHRGELTDAERTKYYQENVLDGTVSGGNGVNLFDPNFVDAPDLTEVESGGGGLPSSPYTPNLTSPGPGSVNPADMPAYEGELPDPTQKVLFGTGQGGLVSPQKTSKEISKASLGNYISGRSYLGSDGRI